MYSVNLGERLTFLRSIMGSDDLDLEVWSRTRLAREAQVPLAALTRLEKTGGGTAATLAALLHFYQGQGFNVAWVLAPDNAQVPYRVFQDAFVDMRTQEATHVLVDLRRLVQLPATDLRIGNESSPEGQHPLLAQIREGIHRALGYLLPRIALIESEGDFRQFQRVMPPVAATAAGWRSAAVHVPPYHYYDADSSLPRCGVPLYYLQFDKEPTDPSNSIKCYGCAHDIGEAWASGYQETPRSNPFLRRA